MQRATRLLAAAVLSLGAATASQAAIVFDALTGIAGSGPATAPNTFIGEAVNLTAGTTSITGFDTVLVTPATATTTANLRLNIYVFDTFTPASTTAVFSNSLGVFSFNFGAQTLAANSAFAINGLTLGTPLAITGDNQLGFTFNWQTSEDGTNFVNTNGLTVGIHAGPAPTVGSNATGASPTFGYYRNVGGQTTGNFVSTDSRQIGNDSNISFRVNGVPEPTSLSLLGLGGLALLRRKR